MKKVYLFSVILLLGIVNSLHSQSIIDHTHHDITAIPEEWINAAKDNLHIYYGHESHGFQLTSGGMQALRNYSSEFNTRYAFDDNEQANSLHLVETNSSLSIPGWDATTAAHLDANPETNVVIWAWCNIIDEDVVSVKDYLDRMENLISIYGPGGSANRANPVQFVFMTGHANSRFPEAYYRDDPTNEPTVILNDSIRDHCIKNGRWLYDFNSFEMYDPDGNYYGDGLADGTLFEYTGTKRLKDDCSYLLSPPEDNLRGNWNHEWMAANPSHLLTQLTASDNCTECAHSDGSDSDNGDARLHCVTKGIGAWHLWARLAGWSGSSEPPTAVSTINVSSAGNQTEITTDGGTLQFSAEVLPSDATNKAVTWSVTNGSGSATVNTSGLVTAQTEGDVTVVATAQDGSGVSGNFTLSIAYEDISVEDIILSSESDLTTIIREDGTLQLYAEVLPADATNKAVTWSVSNGTGSASVNTTGLVTEQTEGTITVFATAQDGSGVSESFDIIIAYEDIPVTSIDISSEDDLNTIHEEDGTLQFYADVLPINASNKALTWSITNGTGSASVNASGLVTAQSEGNVTVVATAQDGSGVFESFNLTIDYDDVLVSDIEVNSVSSSMDADGGTQQMLINIQPANATNQAIVWSVINGTGTASVSPTGMVTAHTPGTVTIVATAQDGSGVSGNLILTLEENFIFISDLIVSCPGNATEIDMSDGLIQMEAGVSPANASNKAVAWSVECGVGDAEISESGELIPLAQGTVCVIASAQDGSGLITRYYITIIDDVTIADIDIYTESNIEEITSDDGSLQFFANIYPEAASSAIVRWSVINFDGKASINENGELTAIEDGEVIVVATSVLHTNIYDTYVVKISGQQSPLNIESNNVDSDDILRIDNYHITLTHNIDYNGFVIVRMVNINGQVLLERKMYSGDSVNIGHLKKGLYVAQYLYNNNWKSALFLK